MHRPRQLLKIALACAVLISLVLVVEGSRGSESCQCFFTGPCEFDEYGIGYRYQLCRGNCAAYSSWSQYAGCYGNQSFERQLIP
ncbi:hypothetical protein J4219_06315 [Candidatus Woesearchaeota archaeon]|nr:hypothetical protein [Candidatus Woesearchaeota archaeon]